MKARAVINFIITLLIILLSSNPITVSNRLFQLYVFIIVFIVFLYRKRKFDKQVVYVMLVTFLIALIQGMFWGFTFFTFFTFTLLTVLIPYFAIKIIGINYLKSSSEIVYYSAIISLILYSGQLFFPEFTTLLMGIESYFHNFNSTPERPSILIYSIAVNTIDLGNFANILRNPGMFHEPGAFAVFIDLAIVINLFLVKKPFSRKNIILIIALLTTFSTAGYLALVIIYFIYFSFIREVNFKSTIIALIAMIPIMIYISSLPFMSSKIEENFESQANKNISNETSGRIFGARKALIVLYRYPLHGRGLIQSSRVSDLRSDEAAGYGFMNFFSQIGLIFSVFFIYFFIRGLIRISFFFKNYKSNWLLLFGGLIINLFSQHFIATAFFIMFFYIGLIKEFNINNKMFNETK